MLLGILEIIGKYWGIIRKYRRSIKEGIGKVLEIVFEDIKQLLG